MTSTPRSRKRKASPDAVLSADDPTPTPTVEQPAEQPPVIPEPDAWQSDPTLVTLRGHLATLRAQREAVEELEQRRLRTPLRLRLELVSCRWAVEQWSDERTNPIISFPTVQCHLGKQQPDQDCVECVYCKIVPYGMQLPAHQRRYHSHGMVIPLEEREADELSEYLASKNLRPLRRIDHEIRAVEVAVGEMERRLAADATRARLEAQQRGRPQ